jgi:exosortase/archaeosortase
MRVLACALRVPLMRPAAIGVAITWSVGGHRAHALLGCAGCDGLSVVVGIVVAV